MKYKIPAGKTAETMPTQRCKFVEISKNIPKNEQQIKNIPILEIKIDEYLCEKFHFSMLLIAFLVR